jgi:aminoglycoside/choline kinase family phosphotransferase
MYVPNQHRPDEIVTHDESTQREWPFLEVRRLLEARGIRVPRLLGSACDDGFILVEDLGDWTLASYLAEHENQRESLYRTAVLDLARAQRALDGMPSDSIVRRRRFDGELLRWEVHHFREWALEARGFQLSADDQRVFARAADYLAHTISGWPCGFVHRDYQSRNLMVKTGSGKPELVWIDFQDALMGPRVYDLVALLSDSYQTFSREFVEARLDDYGAWLGLSAAERQAVGREFDLVTVQRKLKDAGRFVYIDRVNGNPSFLQFVDPTLEKIRGALARLQDVVELRSLSVLLDRVLP